MGQFSGKRSGWRLLMLLLGMAAAGDAAATDARGQLVPLQPVQQIAIGGAFSCAVVGQSKVYCWGNNLYGQLGSGGEYNSVDPQPIPGLPDAPIDALAAGGGHACALAQGNIWCWGYNQFGQLGDGSTTSRVSAVAVLGVAGAATQIAAGDYHTCAVINNVINCWGNNFYGQLGSGDDLDSLVPAPVNGLGGAVVQLSTGSLHTCATVEAAAWCWGNNLSGQIGNGTVAAAQYSPTAVAGMGTGVAEVSAGSTHSCARLATGTVFCWGGNDDGQLGTGNFDAQLTPAVVDNLAQPALSIAAGALHSCARLADRVMCWGDDRYGQVGNLGSTPNPRKVAGLGGVLAIATRNAHSCARRADGTAACWGFNLNGQLGDGSAEVRTAPVAVSGSYGNPALIAAGTNHTCAAVAAGLHCWGYNANGNLGRGTQSTNESLPGPVINISQRPTSLAAGANHSCAVVGGGLQCWGSNDKGQLGIVGPGVRPTPNPVTGMAAGVSQVAAGERHTCAIRSGGVWCWGYNGNGELGDGSTDDSETPVAVSGLSSGVSWISAGANHTCAVRSGAALCWGLNTDGQLGLGTADGFLRTPQPVTGLSSGVTRISAGISHSCAVQSGGALCWGYDGYGALGNGIVNDHQYVPAAVSGLAAGVSEIVAGDDISCAIYGASVRCWGADYSGDLGNGGGVRSLRLLPTPVIGLSGIAAGALSIGGTHVCAATVGGGLRCWGDDFLGALGIGRVVISSGPLPVMRQDRLFADGYD